MKFAGLKTLLVLLRRHVDVDLVVLEETNCGILFTKARDIVKRAFLQPGLRKMW